MKLFALLLVLAFAVVAEWPPVVVTQKGNRIDEPAAHPLTYFTQDPALRDEAGDFCYFV